MYIGIILFFLVTIETENFSKDDVNCKDFLTFLI